jgi:hypothetical protein
MMKMATLVEVQVALVFREHVELEFAVHDGRVRGSILESVDKSSSCCQRVLVFTTTFTKILDYCEIT